ncbi:MAG: four helix bundle protein [Gemmatimonadaceae bacterium]
MRDPHNLRVADMAMNVAVLTYGLTKRLPAEERFLLSQQMRRASVSIGPSIWEGCGRNTDKQFLYFLEVANSSAFELEFQTRLAHRLRFATAAEVGPLVDSIASTQRMLAKLSSTVRGSE